MHGEGVEKARNIFFIFVACVVLMACRDEVRSVVEHATDPETTPTMATDSVRTLVSDSGITKYRISFGVSPTGCCLNSSTRCSMWWPL